MTTTVDAQTPTTSTAVLRSALDAEAYSRQQSDQAFFREAKLRLPVLEELEFRTETHEFDPRMQEYALRFKFNSRRQVRVQERINGGEEVLREYALLEYLEELLYARYQVLVDLWYQREILDLSAERAAWYRDRERLIRQRLAERGERAYDELLKLEDDRLTEADRRRRAASRTVAARGLIAAWTDTATDTVLLTAWPTVEELSARWETWRNDTLVMPWSVQRQRVRAELAALELAAEEAEERNRLNFFQLRYRGDNDNPPLNEGLTLGVGVSLPFRSARSVKNQYLELERREEVREGAERAERWQARLAAAEIRLAARFERCRELRAAYDSYLDRYAPDRLVMAGVSDPAVLLRAREGVFHRRELLVEARHELYEAYLEVLLLNGRMSTAPYRNWLTADGETF